MESEGEIQVSSPSHSEISTTHTPNVDDEKVYEFPPEGSPYTGRVLSLSYAETRGPMLPRRYVTLSQLVLSTPSASSLYQNPI